MHALEVIVARNARAAGREMAHADNDGKYALSERILATTEWAELDIETPFIAGYSAGRGEK